MDWGEIKWPSLSIISSPIWDCVGGPRIDSLPLLGALTPSVQILDPNSAYINILPMCWAL